MQEPRFIKKGEFRAQFTINEVVESKKCFNKRSFNRTPILREFHAHSIIVNIEFIIFLFSS